MRKVDVEQSLWNWLKGNYPSSELYTEFQSKSEYKMQADLAMIQSKSNILHVFEIKTRIHPESFNSFVWALKSFYANYKWLVLPEDKYRSMNLVYSTLAKKGIGLILFSGEERYSFWIKLKAKYLNGNFIEYWPGLCDHWYR